MDDKLTQEQFLAEIRKTVNLPEGRYKYSPYNQRHDYTMGRTSIHFVDFCANSNPWVVHVNGTTFEGDSFRDVFYKIVVAYEDVGMLINAEKFNVE